MESGRKGSRKDRYALVGATTDLSADPQLCELYIGKVHQEDEKYIYGTKGEHFFLKVRRAFSIFVTSAMCDLSVDCRQQQDRGHLLEYEFHSGGQFP